VAARVGPNRVRNKTEVRGASVPPHSDLIELVDKCCRWNAKLELSICILLIPIITAPENLFGEVKFTILSTAWKYG
jgi:hypothetical protein